MYFFAEQVEEEEKYRGYIPGIYMKSEWEPPVAHEEVKERLDLDNFEG